MKERNETGTDTEGEKMPLKLTKSTSLVNASTDSAANSSPLNLQVIKSPDMMASTALAGSGAPAYQTAPSSSFAIGTPPGDGKFCCCGALSLFSASCSSIEMIVVRMSSWQVKTEIWNMLNLISHNVFLYQMKTKFSSQ